MIGSQLESFFEPPERDEIMEGICSYCPCSALPYRINSLDSNIDCNIASYLTVAIALEFIDSNNGSGRNIPHCEGDANIRMRPKVIYTRHQHCFVARPPHQYINLNFVNIINILQKRKVNKKEMLGRCERNL